VAAFVVPLIWWFYLSAPVANAFHSILPIGLEAIQSKQLGGFMISVIIGLCGIAFSLPIGVVLALGRQSDLFAVKTICVGFIEFIRGVPLITLLFTASLLLNYFLPPGTNFDIVLRVIIMVTFFAAAYMAETIRGGLAALPKGQYEAADSLGLDYWKAQRLIIMPQALKISIPGIVGNFIGLFKDTTLVIFIGIFDMLGLTNSIRADVAWNGVYWELFIFVAAVFWVCCFSMSRYSQWLERKLQTDHR
jgi:general L-amino acid transport system permease protein